MSKGMRQMKIEVAEVLKARLPKLQHLIPRCAVRWLERTICQDRLNEILRENAEKVGAEFARGVMKSLNASATLTNPQMMPDQASRRVLFVSNHPLGGLDGMALIDIIQRHYGGQVWFVVNDLLMFIEPLQSVFLPINKFGGQSRDAARRIDEAFSGNDPIIMFPAGLCSRLQTIIDTNGHKSQVITDLEWRKTFVTKALQYNRTIIPLFFSGRNSMHFYKTALRRKRLGIKFNIEMLYLPQEMVNSQGKAFTVTLGQPIDNDHLKSLGTPEQAAKKIKKAAYDLCPTNSDTLPKN